MCAGDVEKGKLLGEGRECVWGVRKGVVFVFFFFNASATAEIYTEEIVGSVRCV